MKPRVFEEKATEFIRGTGMFDGCNSVLVACSGGADSVALVRLLNRISALFSISLTIAHVNHNLRGDASISDQLFVSRFSQSIGLPFVALSVRIGEFAGTLEERARRIRLSALEHIRKQTTSELIAVGHNSGDRAETVLHNLARGAGLTGLSTMKSRNGRIVRPLLNTTRNDVMMYLNALGQDYIEDESNNDLRFSRNRIRHRVIPELEKIFSGATRSISRFAQLADEDNTFLNGIAKHTYTVCVKEFDEGIEIDIEKLLNNENAIIRRVLRMCLTDCDSTPTLSVVDSVIQRMRNGIHTEFQLAGRSFELKSVIMLIRPLRD